MRGYRNTRVLASPLAAVAAGVFVSACGSSSSASGGADKGTGALEFVSFNPASLLATAR